MVRDWVSKRCWGTLSSLETADEMAQQMEAVYEDALENGASQLGTFKRAQIRIRDWPPDIYSRFCDTD